MQDGRGRAGTSGRALGHAGGGGLRRAAAPSLLLSLGVLVVALTLIPLGFVVVYALGSAGTRPGALIFRPRVGELLANTVTADRARRARSAP